MIKNRVIIVISVVLYTIVSVVIIASANPSAGLQATSADLPLDMDEPIAFIGHGAMFDLQGNEIEPSPKFLQDAQAYYLNKLAHLATSEQQTQLQTKQANLLAETDLNVREQMIVNSALIDWLIDEVQLADAGALQGKNNFIGGMIRDLYPSISDYPMDGDSELSSLLGSEGLLRSTRSSSEIAADNEQYIKECVEAGVPEPPGWGDAKWKEMAPLDPHLLFITLKGKNRTGWPIAKSYVYVSESPANKGVCMALPRIHKNNKIIGLLGIICMGQESSNACFWDNQKDGKNFTIPIGEKRNIADFAGGKQLFDGSGGICTDCHAGENAFVIHPDRLDPARLDPAGIDLKVRALLQPFKWYKPMVDSRWPQNPGPSPTLNHDDGKCMGCHDDGERERIRFPDITKDLDGYCTVVFENSISQDPIENTDPPLTLQTMPKPSIDLSSYADHIREIRTACDLRPSPTAASTIKVDKGDLCSARTLKFTVVISNRYDDKVANVQVTSNFENLTLDPDSVKIAPGSGVTGPIKPAIYGNAFTWVGDFDGKTQITIEYTAQFGGDALKGTLGTNTVTIEDGIAKVVLSESANALKPLQPPGPPPPLTPGLNNFVYLPLTQWTVEGCSPYEPPPPPEYAVSISGIGLENGRYLVNYETSGYSEQLPGRHVHFYFDTVAEADAGMPGNGPWILYGGPRPFTQYGVSDRPAQATAMCARVANADHSIVPGSGNCFPLPADPLSVSITSIGLENGRYLVNYETSGYTEQLPGRHVHFYFDTVAEADAGVPGNGPWILYGGPRPFTQYGVSDRPAQATAMCARVAHADHSIIPGSGNCFPLPEPLLADDFSNPNSGWPVLDDIVARWSYQNGEYEILLREPGWRASALAPISGLVDYAVEAEMRRPSGSTSDYGLIFDFQDWDNFYYFIVDPSDQWYGVAKFINGVAEWIVLPTNSPLINLNSSINHLKVERVGDQIDLYVNGNHLEKANDAGFGGGLDVGLFMDSDNDAPASIRYDNFFVLGNGPGLSTSVGLGSRSAEIPANEADQLTRHGP